MGYESVCRSAEVLVLAQRVANKESLNLSQEELRQVAESAGGDLRQLLNQLQLVQLQRGIASSSHTNPNSLANPSDRQSVIISEECKRKKSSSLSLSGKDDLLGLSPFSATRMLLTGEGPLNQRYSAVFSDYELVPLLLQQNYLEPLKGEGSMESAALAADAIAEMELAHAAMVGRNVGKGEELQRGLVAAPDRRLDGSPCWQSCARKLRVPAVPSVDIIESCEIGCWGRVRRCGRMDG